MCVLCVRCLCVCVCMCVCGAVVCVCTYVCASKCGGGGKVYVCTKSCNRHTRHPYLWYLYKLAFDLNVLTTCVCANHV
jgi:hypothetical protein